MALDAVTNFGYATLSAGIDSDDTSITLTTGHGARLPSTAFNAPIWDTSYSSPTAAYHAGAAEIVRVTARSTDTLTVTRAQEGTTARSFNTSGRTYAIGVALTKATYDQLAPAASPTFTGTTTVDSLVINKGITIAPAPMGALVVDVAELRNAVSIAVNSTLTFSATPATGATFGLTITETSGTAREVTFPESYSQNLGVPITVFTVPANGIVDVSWEKTATGYKIFGDPLTVAQQKVVLDLQVVDIFGLQSELDAKAEETHAHSAADITSGVLAPARIAAGGAKLQVARINAEGTALEFADETGGGGGGTFSMDDGDATADPATIASFDDGDATTA